MNKIIGVFILVLSVVVISCNKEPDIQSQEVGLTEKSAAIVLDEVAVENAESEINYEANFYANAEKSITQMARKGNRWNWKNILRYQIGQCPDVTIDSTETGYPKTLTLDYGDGVELRNGRVLSGTITMVVTAPPKTNGSSKTVTYTDFSVDSVSVSGTSVFQFVGDNVATRKHIHTGNLFFTLPNGKIINREVEKTREWLAGIDTDVDMTDDIIQITGSVEVSNSDGDEYSKAITKPLLKMGGCRFFVEGTVEISVNGETKIIIDYGNGECDGSASVTKDGETRTINLQGKNPKMGK